MYAITYIHILREASALFARSTKMGNAKASERENEQQVRLSRFFLYIRKGHRGKPGGKSIVKWQKHLFQIV